MKQIIRSQEEYGLIDSGEGEKLERFGKFVLRRPDPQALWSKQDGPQKWADADASFVRPSDSKTSGKWNFKKNVPKSWNIKFGGLNLKISPTPFKHTGLFPEQLENWQWVENKIENFKSNNNAEPSILNLFGYTGGASLSALKNGAKVCHVDASKSAINWGKENLSLSGLEDKSIRWILDDAHSFVKKEIKRGKKYDGIIMDPPPFGHSPDGDMWRIEEGFVELVSDVKKILSNESNFLLINGYSAGYSSTAYAQNIEDLKQSLGGIVEDGEIFIEDSHKRLLPCGIFARWGR